ncbi:MAG TPA: tRNA epoxyqueuosine(34) reductase QueG [Capsulimonadaceae bacterium]|nr:tRNA epoxyqueuosine(34) reductase QueG [Capsulimonadaceae bacterium]
MTGQPNEPTPALARSIKARAATLGFSLCGITSADPLPHQHEYQNWLAHGHAGEMEYLARQEPKRGDLQAVLPGARSAVVVAFNYYAEDETASDTDALCGTVARYARFDDYHEAVWERLGKLLAFIQEERPGAQGKVYCDTGPITERDLAMRAGIGWIGKHTNLISRRLGNWFFLGEILLDIDLPADTPSQTHCGTCTRCIPACPTGAILAPYVLDARRCISYLTIELKGSIPEGLRPLIGTRIYGCDDCLQACPWNKFAMVSDDPAVQPRADLAAPDLIALLELDDDGFRERFRNSPIRRTKRRGLLRNVCVALGNLGDPRALPALEKALSDPEPLVREHAAWAIERINLTPRPPSLQVGGECLSAGHPIPLPPGGRSR